MIALVARLPSAFKPDQKSDRERDRKPSEELFMIHVSSMPRHVIGPAGECQIPSGATLNRVLAVRTWRIRQALASACTVMLQAR